MSQVPDAVLGMGTLGLLWAVAFRAALRVTPPELIPGFLHQRVRRTHAATRYVAAVAVGLLPLGAAMKIT